MFSLIRLFPYFRFRFRDQLRGVGDFFLFLLSIVFVLISKCCVTFIKCLSLSLSFVSLFLFISLSLSLFFVSLFLFISLSSVFDLFFSFSLLSLFLFLHFVFFSILLCLLPRILFLSLSFSTFDLFFYSSHLLTLSLSLSYFCDLEFNSCQIFKCSDIYVTNDTKR